MSAGLATSVAVVVLFVTGAYAACPDLRSAGGELGYRQRAKQPDRCEGMYQSPIAGESIELLSFVNGPITFNPKVDRTLTVTAPNIAALGPALIDVTARALPPRIYYRMDATVDSGGSLQWALGDVVIPARLDGSDLGLLGRVPRGTSNVVFVPLRISNEKHPAVVIFRTPIDIEAFQWRLIVGRQAPPAWNTFGGLGRTVLAGDRIELTLDGISKGLATLDIAAKPVIGEYIRAQYQIFTP
jgi:hypothetical protein